MMQPLASCLSRISSYLRKCSAAIEISDDFPTCTPWRCSHCGDSSFLDQSASRCRSLAAYPPPIRLGACPVGTESDAAWRDAFSLLKFKDLIAAETWTSLKKFRRCGRLSPDKSLVLVLIRIARDVVALRLLNLGKLH